MTVCFIFCQRAPAQLMPRAGGLSDPGLPETEMLMKLRRGCMFEEGLCRSGPSGAQQGPRKGTLPWAAGMRVWKPLGAVGGACRGRDPALCAVPIRASCSRVASRAGRAHEDPERRNKKRESRHFYIIYILLTLSYL